MANIEDLLQEGHNCHQTGNLAAAAQLYQKILDKQPGNIDAIFLLGTLNLQQGNLETATIFLRKAIELKPDHVVAYNNLGTVLQKQRKLDEAVLSFNQAITLKPDYADAYYNLGNAFIEQGKLDEAVNSYRNAISHNPGDAEMYYNLGNVLKEQGKLDEAVGNYRQAIKHKPDFADAHMNMSVALLLAGKLEEGWPEYEWRLCTKDDAPKNFKQPQWDGSPLNGQHILVHAEQGFGDTIHFVRYLPMVKAQGGYVLFECQRGLSKLLENCAGIDEIVERTPDKETTNQFDVHVPLLSLPGIFGTTLDTIPSDIPYITVDPKLVDQWHMRLDHNNDFKIGIVWAGSPKHKKDRYRSCSLADFVPLFNIPDLSFYGLQKGPASVDTLDPPKWVKLTNLGDELNDFADTAAVIANLELVISVDTAVAHLAGAIGKPVWNLLHSAPDWRWLLNRDDSSWYPSMRLFRQTQFYDWIGVFERVKKELLKEFISPKWSNEIILNQTHKLFSS
ncbi:MAG: tetratricopeptide repeat protein [Candidatus Scalinduaceae bacterium]